jgi:AcrR family transcriptional regulator
MSSAAVVQKPGPARGELLELARQRFLRGQKLDVQTLASELGVSRATAYRWAGNADRLAAEVVAMIAEETFHRSARGVRSKGAERVVEVMEKGMRAVVGSAPYRAFLERDPQKALRLVASKEGPSQARMVELHQRLLEDEIERGSLRIPVDPHTMAYALVRLAESFMYSDLIAGEEPDIDSAVEIVRLLLRSDA